MTFERSVSPASACQRQRQVAKGTACVRPARDAALSNDNGILLGLVSCDAQHDEALAATL